MTYYVGLIPCIPSDIRHFGIPGMKWGIRRYRNPDGTLTDAGKARYSESTGKKGPENMTDKELKSAVERLRNETAWKENMEKLHPSPVKKGKNAVGKLLSTIGNRVIAPALETGTKAFVNAMADDAKQEMTIKKKQDAEKEEQRKKDEARRKYLEEY